MSERIPLLANSDDAIPVHLVGAGDLSDAVELSDATRRFVGAQNFQGEAGKILVLPAPDGSIAQVLFGTGGDGPDAFDPLSAGRLATALPAGVFRLASPLPNSELAAVAFALGGYRFEDYRKARPSGPRLVVPEGVDFETITAIAEGVYLARDLVNKPANDLGPDELAAAARDLGERFGAETTVTAGPELQAGFPMIHAVGTGSDRPPCLVDMRWGDVGDPKVTLVGKGIVFDTGGLDIKPSSAMLLMKKDMGGGANVLGLASMIMRAGLKLRLRVLLPIAENMISGRSFRPGDVLRSRKGLSVEIGNTDAEGRLVLADALALADEEAPDLLVCMATLTGAARVALGPELPPFYTDDETLAAGIAAASAAVSDPVWRMPFYKPYDGWLASRIADLNHIASNPYAGSVVAALFLRRFVDNAKSFAHFDIFAWNPTPRSAGPEGGEAQAIRALFRHLAATYR